MAHHSNAYRYTAFYSCDLALNKVLSTVHQAKDEDDIGSSSHNQISFVRCPHHVSCERCHKPVVGSIPC